MAYATIPGDCIDRVTAQNGHKVIFERLATPKPAPKVTLKRIKPAAARTASAAAHFQHRRHKTLEAEGDQTLGNRMQSISKMDVDTHLGDKEVSTDAFSNNEANDQVIQRVKVGSNNICIREHLAQEKMVFSEESSQAVFEMGNVELIELRTLLIQCTHAYTTFFN